MIILISTRELSANKHNDNATTKKKIFFLVVFVCCVVVYVVGFKLAQVAFCIFRRQQQAVQAALQFLHQSAASDLGA